MQEVTGGKKKKVVGGGKKKIKLVGKWEREGRGEWGFLRTLQGGKASRQKTINHKTRENHAKIQGGG